MSRIGRHPIALPAGVKVNLEDYSVDELYTFEEPVQSYIKSGKFEFVLLDSGLYVI